MKLVAIDFETADQGADSACAVGVATIENGRIRSSEARLIRPPRREFVFSYLHGITWNDVRRAAPFAEVWDGVRAHWSDADYFVAHNASFDRGVLAACLSAAGQEPPALPFICTVKVARWHWNFRPANLSYVCRRLGIPLRHHDAASDALACASIAVRALREGFPIHTAVVGARRGGQ
jgi:DNA polymerase-3 subunit epsilon